MTLGLNANNIVKVKRIHPALTGLGPGSTVQTVMSQSNARSLKSFGPVRADVQDWRRRLATYQGGFYLNKKIKKKHIREGRLYRLRPQ